MPRGLYIHIPFCVTKCSYCDFYSLTARLDLLEPYVQAVIQEARLDKNVILSEAKYLVSGDKRLDSSLDLHPVQNDNTPFQTLYIGGGTPSLLGAKHLRTLMDGLDKTLRLPCHSALRNEVEATIEVNPESATPEFLIAAKESGFNRVSFGVQSLSDDELRSVGRIHTAEQAIEAVILAKKIGFEAISADLIIGLPGQTWPSLQKSLNTLIKLGVQHLSVYCLTLEEGTLLKNNPPADLPSDDMQAKLFEETRNFLKICGYAHYEISNFALRGYECRHNLNYWHGGEYLGLGTAAASHLNGIRFRNRADLDAYIKNPTTQIEEIETLDIEEKAAEEAMLRLRLIEEGIDIIELAERFGEESIEGIVQRLEGMAQEGLLIKEGMRYRLAPERILTSNPIFARVITK
jgi:oxygen-independent coproporphyrinogen III oxidase